MVWKSRERNGERGGDKMAGREIDISSEEKCQVEIREGSWNGREGGTGRKGNEKGDRGGGGD